MKKTYEVHAYSNSHKIEAENAKDAASIVARMYGYKSVERKLSNHSLTGNIRVYRMDDRGQMRVYFYRALK